MSSMNGGFPNGERASLLSGLRTSGPRMSAQQQQQQQEMQLYLQQQQQQQQFYNAVAQNNPAQAQLFAFQQSQIELQLQQIQMANLALQDQILRQQQQAMQQQVQAAQQQQQNQPQRQPSPPYSNSRSSQRGTSASPVVEQKAVWTGNEHDAAARQERWGALRNLQQARKQREVSPATTTAQSVTSSAGNNNDWQAERMRYAAKGSNSPDHSSGPGTPVASPPLVTRPTSNIVTALENIAKQSAAREHGHNKTASTASSASVQSLSISEAGSQFSPNKGPALVLSSPGDDDFDEDDAAGFPLHGGKEEPMSPSLNASMRAVNIHGRMAEAARKQHSEEKKEAEKKKGDRKSSSKKRHTLILSSSLPAFAAGASKTSETSSIGDSGSDSASSSSSGSLSPTASEKSEVASFESTATNATSAPATSPTSASHAEKEKDQVVVGLLEEEKAAVVPVKTMNAKAAVFNPNATAFSPAAAAATTSVGNDATPAASAATSLRYPGSLSLRSQTSTPVATPPPSMRIFTAPASVGSSYSGTPNNASNNANSAITVLRQPKGPVDEAELGTKNFAGMIRRKAVGALRVATFSGGRISPVSSPVVGGFPGDVSAFQQQQQQSYGSPQMGMGMPSPTMQSSGAFAAFGADLAQRAMKRRSQQMQLGGVGGVNPGLGMY